MKVLHATAMAAVHPVRAACSDGILGTVRSRFAPLDEKCLVGAPHRDPYDQYGSFRTWPCALEGLFCEGYDPRFDRAREYSCGGRRR